MWKMGSLLCALLATSASCRHPDAPVALSREEAARDAFALLSARCGHCHDRAGGDKGLDYILDREALVKNETITPGDRDGSLLWQRVTSDEQPMPPEGERLSASELAVLEQWIKLGAPAPATTTAGRPKMSLEQLLQAAVKDLEHLSPEERRFRRYFRLDHLYHDPRLSNDTLRHYRAAISKLLNSLSWRSRIVPPRVIDHTQECLLSIDLRDYGWDEGNAGPRWKLLEPHYPYGLSHDSFPDDGETRRLSARLSELSRAAGIGQIWLRGDWFLAVASRPPLYARLLDVPPTLTALEEKLGVQAATALRAGLKESGVSHADNRVLQRLASAYGAFVQSYDFAPQNSKGDLLAHPLGPKNSRVAMPGLEFEPDGGEYIFHLPNGLLAFAITNREGAFLDSAPESIVSDRDGVSGGTSIVSGLSCMHCHADGYILSFRDVVADGAPFGGEVQRAIRRLYDEEKLKAALAEDNERYLAALEKAVRPFLRNASVSSERAAVGNPGLLVRRYQTALIDVQDAARELGHDVTPNSVEQTVRSHPILRRSGVQALLQGGLPRREWERQFHSLSDALGLGTPQAPLAGVERL